MAKMPKVEARYKVATSSEERRCDHCSMFIVPNSCSAVEGPIAPGAVCKLFEAKDDDYESE